jgi:hypothetical protein
VRVAEREAAAKAPEKDTTAKVNADDDAEIVTEKAKPVARRGRTAAQTTTAVQTVPAEPSSVGISGPPGWSRSWESAGRVVVGGAGSRRANSSDAA